MVLSCGQAAVSIVVQLLEGAGSSVRILKNVQPTPEQLAIITSSAPGFRVIRGAAGSGKTTTALLRLKALCNSRLDRRNRLGVQDPVDVLVLTYNKTLRGYIYELARSQVRADPGLNLTVTTFAKWAVGMVGETVDDVDGVLNKLITPACSSSRSASFLLDEVDYALGRFERAQLDSYLDCERTGRGIAPRMERSTRSQLLHDVMRPYNAYKDQYGLMDWNDLALRCAEVKPSAGYDVVIVDEAQDFSANQVRAVLAHLAPDHSTTFVLDAMQRIYPRSFQWKEVGIPQTQATFDRLKKNHRNTAEIAAFARPLVEGLPLDDDGSTPDFSACTASGRKPIVVSGRFSRQMNFMLNYIENEVDLNTESVAFLHPLGWFRDVRAGLDSRGIPYCEITRQSAWPQGPEQVALSTIHSAKGLEFDHVIIPGLNQETTPHGSDDDDAGLDNLRRLLAMGIGRARKSVVIGYKPNEASSLIALLDPATFEAEVRP